MSGAHGLWSFLSTLVQVVPTASLSPTFPGSTLKLHTFHPSILGRRPLPTVLGPLWSGLAVSVVVFLGPV